MDSQTTSGSRFPALKTGNYPQWSGDMRAWLMSKGLWRLVKGDEKEPVAADDEKPTEAEAKAKGDWQDRALRAAGELYLAISDDQKTHLDSIEDDPVKIWTKLASVHLQKVAGARFNAWESFFSIQMRPEESLSDLMTRIDAAMLRVKNLCPDPYSIKDLDEELVCMTMIRDLPAEYQSFASSLQLLDQISKDKLQAAFINEQQLRSSSLSTSQSPSHVIMQATQLLCSFCDLPGHLVDTCTRYRIAKATASKDAAQRQEERKKAKKRGGKAQAAQEVVSTTPDVSSASEFAGKIQAPLLI